MTRDVNDVMHRKRAQRILGDLKKAVSWVLPRKKTVDFHLLALALGQVHTWGGGDGRLGIERMCICLLMSKNL